MSDLVMFFEYLIVRAIMFSDYLEDWVAGISSGEGYKENICCRQIPLSFLSNLVGNKMFII